MSKTAGDPEPKLSELSPAAQNAVQSKVIGGAWTVPALVQLLAELEQWDLKIEANRKQLKKFYIGSWVASVLGFVAFIMVSASAGFFSIGPFLFAIPVVCVVVLRRKFKAVKSNDLPNELRQLIRPMLHQLSQDVHPQAKVKVTINLAGIDEKRGTTTTIPPTGRNSKVTLSVFQQEPWDVRMPLADGSTAVLRVNSAFHKLHRHYRGSSGKSKSKVKWKKLSTATVMLIPPQQIKWESERVQPFMDTSRETLTFSESNGVTVARLDRHYKFKKPSDPPEDSIPVEDVIGLFIRLVAMQPSAAGGTP